MKPYLILPTKKPDCFWIDREGNKVSFREFIKRFKQGVIGITPLQQTKISLMGLWLIVTGVLWGIVVTFYGRVLWMTVILFGSLIVVGVQMLGMYQKYRNFKKIEEAIKNAR